MVIGILRIRKKRLLIPIISLVVTKPFERLPFTKFWRTGENLLRFAANA